MSEDFLCSHCGETVAAGASFCRHCGASDEFGWDKEDPWSETHPDDDDGGYGDGDFDYDDFVAREFPEHAEPDHARLRGNRGTFWLIVLICTMLVVGALFAAMAGRF